MGVFLTEMAIKDDLLKKETLFFWTLPKFKTPPPHARPNLF